MAEGNGRAAKHCGQGDIASLKEQIGACRICVETPVRAPLPHEPRPVVVLSSTARLCLSGQAPGTRVHASGRPFTDPSGDRLRSWLGIDEETFYDSSKVSIVPMGFCFPGLDSKGGDKPPRTECRRNWHPQVFRSMPQVETVIAIGKYAQDYHLGPANGLGLWQRVAAWKEIWQETSKRYEAGEGPRILPLPHPSWRNNTALKKNSWFDGEVVPFLQEHVKTLLRPDR
ncbi:uracil-DNA glycosylase family protein [Rhodobacteraceae bacterium RKSG542]|uniref:uracil-DNA glycosylase family protein n=1 Tax=Pseudovibrio flavus TaxID=2529854 RepID=UPI0012BCDB4E|nr:uracil-DNA glycosylase family protein [Pseudovibrio flavus]MTI16983.1 uracil-DNA glycosylase family protein [Pseudovibrio flavus]